MIKLGEVESLVDQDLLDLCADKSRICISGFSRSGKSLIAKKLSEELNLPVIQTDDYKELPWTDQPEAIIEDLSEPHIVCGVTVPRVLRTGAKLEIYEPELSIWCKINNESLLELYGDQSTAKIFAFNKGLTKIYLDWYVDRKCEAITLDTSFVEKQPIMEIL